MHIVEREIRKKYRYSNLSYVFDVYMECEYRANLTQEEYDGLLPGEFRFDYESWERRLGFSKKQLVRAIKELTINNAVIVQTFKGRKGSPSKYFLTRIGEQEKEQNEEGTEINLKNTEVEGNTGTEKLIKIEEQKKERNEELKRNLKGTEKSLENTEVESSIGTEKGTQKEQKEEQKKVHSSRYNNLDIISNNKKEKSTGIDKIIDDYTNNKELKQTLREFLKMRKAIKKPMTDRAMVLLLGKLDRLSQNDMERIEILNQSILNCWQGIFELKNAKQNSNNEPDILDMF